MISNDLKKPQEWARINLTKFVSGRAKNRRNRSRRFYRAFERRNAPDQDRQNGRASSAVSSGALNVAISPSISS
jgi:hypothetical protein